MTLITAIRSLFGNGTQGPHASHRARFHGTGYYNIAGVPVAAGKEALNFSVVGATGTGKSVLIGDLIEQVRSRGRRMIIHDPTGQYAERFFRPGHDLLLDPFDERCVAWNLLADVPHPSTAHALAEALIEDVAGEPRFWRGAARRVLADIFVHLTEIGNSSMQDLHDVLRLSNADLFDFLKGRSSARFFDPPEKRAADGVRGLLSQATEALLAMPTSGVPFSLREWVRDGQQDASVFLHPSPEHWAISRVLHAAFVEAAVRAQLDCGEGFGERLWLFLDELPRLARIPSLPAALTTGRRHGIVSVVALQDEHQLRHSYGEFKGRSIIAAPLHRVVCHVADPSFAQWCSAWLGDAVTAAELQALGPLNAVYQGPDEQPVCRVDLRPLAARQPRQATESH